jgi:diaminopimelate epimerase
MQGRAAKIRIGMSSSTSPGAASMNIEFIKLQACGSDYILVDTFKNTIVRPQDLPDMAIQITSRRYGVGANGLLLIAQGRKEKLRMLLYNPQGTEIETDGLALRCLARYAFDAGLVNDESFRVETRDASVPVEILDSHNIMTASHGPRYPGGTQALHERALEDFTRTLQLGTRELKCTPLDVEGPQVVIFAQDYGLAFPELAAQVAATGSFPPNTCYSLVRVISREAVSLRAWKRGEGEILASEPAACAGAAAAVLNGLTDRGVKVLLEGGNLLVDWAEADECFYVSGPAEYVFMGTYYYEEGDLDEQDEELQ